MKKKLLLTIVFCAIIISATLTSAFALVYGSISSGTISVTVSGHIDFLEGPGVIPDKIWYYGLLSGSDMNYVTTQTFQSYIQPGTNAHMKDVIYLTGSAPSVSGDQVSCGYGGTYGKLIMHVPGNTKTIHT